MDTRSSPSKASRWSCSAPCLRPARASLPKSPRRSHGSDLPPLRRGRTTGDIEGQCEFQRQRRCRSQTRPERRQSRCAGAQRPTAQSRRRRWGKRSADAAAFEGLRPDPADPDRRTNGDHAPPTRIHGVKAFTHAPHSPVWAGRVKGGASPGLRGGIQAPLLSLQRERGPHSGLRAREPGDSRSGSSSSLSAARDQRGSEQARWMHPMICIWIDYTRRARPRAYLEIVARALGILGFCFLERATRQPVFLSG